MNNLSKFSRYTLLSAVPIIFLFLMSFSCQDHEVPTQNPTSPVIVTLDAASSAGKNVNFMVQFTTLGNIPVSEYGVVFIPNSDFPSGQVPLPKAETHDRAVIQEPVSLDIRSRLNKVNGTAGTAVTYRAYAKLTNGTTVYGVVKEVIIIM